jgi:hypothetical protein
MTYDHQKKRSHQGNGRAILLLDQLTINAVSCALSLAIRQNLEPRHSVGCIVNKWCILAYVI